ncbi:hypothetical protein A4X09_0g7842 [Tilletia walkeri]|uniref:RNase III domain-containing protein n=1 Tax=Tilletia walkeri TaxID=117179 RepID=A0A8X7N2H8_9BASI|nr:hypothetical protein A4X09_0g7842 [Tilletia walkeri]
MPTILDRIHQALSAQRCNKEIFEGKIAATHLIEALTVPSASYSFNYERLEFIGDTFLKLMATAYVFAEEIESQEGLLHNARREIIMNRTLLKHCMDHKLNDFMLLQSFTSRAWVPPNFVNPSGGRATTHPISGPRGEGYLPTAYHSKGLVQQKTLADLAESAMGAGLMTEGMDGALHVARCLNITPRPIHSLGETAELYRQKTSEAIRREKLDSAIDPQALFELEGFLGYTFRSPHIALQATTHQSINLTGMTFSYEVRPTIRAT